MKKKITNNNDPFECTTSDEEHLEKINQEIHAPLQRRNKQKKSAKQKKSGNKRKHAGMI